MELITNILIEYLKHNKRLVVPKLGAFIVKQSSRDIIFSELMRNDDGVLRSLLMAYGMKELEANGLIDRFVFEIRHAISMGESYSIDNFGTFSAGENNTIVFRIKREPQKIGGNIKPPVETLTNEKVKMHRRQSVELDNRSRNESQKSNKQTKRDKSRGKKAKEKESDEDVMTLGKQDAYLRGLKYDKNKNKRRGEERHTDSRRGIGIGRIVLLVAIALIVGAGIWFAWQWLNRVPEQVAEPIIERTEQEPIIAADSLAIDSLSMDTEPIVESDNITTTPEPTTNYIVPNEPKAVEIKRVNNTGNSEL